MQLRRCNAFALALLSMAPAAVSYADASDTAPWESMIRRQMAEAGVPGLSLAIVQRGKPDYIRGFGVRAVDEEGSAVNAGTLFKLNSVTKSMTATAIAIQVDNAVLRWGDRLVNLYPEFQLKDPWITREATLEDALAHRVAMEATDWMEDLPGLQLDEAIRRMRHLPQEGRFRADFVYDNFMYSVAGTAAGASEGGWERLIANRLLAPLGMDQTTTALDREVLPEELALCHECDLDHVPRGLKGLRSAVNVAAPHVYAGGRPQLTHWRWSVTLPAGGVWSNARDMAKYLKLYLDGGVVNGTRLVSSASMHKLTSPLMFYGEPPEEESEYARRASQVGTGYGLGWEVSTYLGQPMIHHDGASIGYQSQVFVLPQAGIGIALLANAKDGTIALTSTLGLDLIDRMLGLPPVEWTRAELDRAQRDKKTAKDVAPAATTDTSPAFFVGAYSHPVYGVINVTQDRAGVLRVDQGLQRTGVLKPWQSNTLQLVWDGVRPGPHLVSFAGGKGELAATLELNGQKFARQ